MPQRPSVYRSFVTCSDPEGVVTCGTVRKERQNMPKSLNMSCSTRGLREEGVGNIRNSSSQLEEIEKGAQKLNKMIDSWASGMSIDGESKDIAQDLLRGALDLQESLNMLSKLQEASLYMAKLKRLEKHDEKARVSVDGSVRSKCVQESPVRQSLLPISYGEYRRDRRGTSFASEGQSTSSDKSSVNISKKACSTDISSISSDISDKNRKRPNLIAKLMGLEDRKPVQAKITSTINEVQNKERVPTFDVPEAKKSHVSTQKRCQEKRTLRELLEPTQSETDLECETVDRLIPIPVPDLLPRTTPKKRNDTDKLPPIVLMKPLHAPYKELVKSQEQCFDASEIVKELKAKNWFSHAQDQSSERLSLMKNEKTSTGKPRILTPETSELPKPAVAKLQSTKTKINEKAVVSVEQTSRANKISKIRKSKDVSISTTKVAEEKNVKGMKTLIFKEKTVSPLKASITTKTQTSISRKLPQAKTSKFTKETSRDYSVGVKKAQNRKGKPATRTLSSDTLRQENDTADVDISHVRTKNISETLTEENWRDVEVIHDSTVQKQSNNHYEDISYKKVSSNTSCLTSRSFQENLLMTSPSFAAFVEDLFHIDQSSTTSKVATLMIDTDTDATLFESYAKEVLERRSNQILFSATSMSIPASVNQLVTEVCEAYEAIDSYKDGRSAVDIFDLLDRDMKCKEVVSSVWDMGWKNECSAVETQQIVAYLEKLILRDFIDEIFGH